MRLSHRLTLVFSLFGVAIAGGFQYNHIRAMRTQSYALTRNMAEVTSSAVRAMVEDQARTGSLTRLGGHMGDMVRMTGVATIVVYEKSGRRLIGRSDDSRLLSRAPHPELPIERVSDGLFDVQLTADLGPWGKGSVLVGFHTAPLEARLAEIAGQAVRSGVMAFLAIALFAWLMGTWFGLRIEQVVPRIEALSRDPQAFRPIRAGTESDEVSRLVAAFNRLGASLKAETQRRREVENEKQELAAMLVHDLKTPLTVIRSGITLLQEQLSDGDRAAVPEVRKPNGRVSGPKRTFELLEMSTARLGRMVEDVLQLARLEELAGLREREPVDLVAMTQACAKDFSVISAERRQKLVCRVPKSVTARVSGDAPLLRRVLDNLVHNAVEHTPAGGTITVSLSEHPQKLRVSVSDSGPGVPAGARADIFRKFYQKDMKRHVGNVGLGLALCEKVILRHEGVIGIEDAEPHGARFFFELPVAEPKLFEG